MTRVERGTAAAVTEGLSKVGTSQSRKEIGSFSTFIRRPGSSARDLVDALHVHRARAVSIPTEEADELDQLVTAKMESVQYDHPNHTVTVTTISDLDLSGAQLLGLTPPEAGRGGS
ncbi:hypothetical protein P7K49_002933 [Saguinus oedipus]|uniref:Uncharacterized protein n=1 Tax=Saguinus oedipus TaxID=9490 RepID=A0ABQ9WIR1_SAGOE|nr:hypothetical protein P7K49_002933 [Saguinus oedipus]